MTKPTNLYPRFYFVRHGQTEWNVKKILQGHADIPLNEQGRQEAAALKEHFKDIHFTACFSSDLQRAHETACIVVDGRDVPVIKDKNLREIHIGVFEGKTAQDYAQATAQELATIEPQDLYIGRITTSLNKLAHGNHQGNVLIVAHGVFMRNMLVHMLDLPLKHQHPLQIRAEIEIKNTGYCKVYFTGTSWVVEELSGITIKSLDTED